MSDRPIAVLGGGNGGHCMAADLALQGRKVHFYELPQFSDNFKSVRKKRRIHLRGMGRDGTARLHVVTHDIGEALDGVDLIFLAVPAFGHDAFFTEMIPHLRNNHLIVLWAGNFGSLRLTRLLRDHTSSKPCVAESNTLPYGTRLTGPGKVALSLIAPSIRVSAMPSEETGRALSLLKDVYPQVKPAANVLAAAFSNPNPIVHPPASLLNTGRIQYSNGTFRLYREGITEAVARVIRDLYMEIRALAGALGFEVVAYKEGDFHTTASIMGVAFRAESDTIGVIGRSFPGPATIFDRYITEDVPCGLCPVSLLGKRYGVATPIADAFIAIAGSVCGIDFNKKGTSLERLGIDNMRKEELIRYLMTGRF